MKEAREGGVDVDHQQKRSATTDKERAKLRERQRRSITSKIFDGLRKHGGYPLSPRSDINQVLRHLAIEAGWTVQSDGTTYRSSSSSSSTTTASSGICPVCGSGIRSRTSTPSSSSGRAGGGGGGGECSTAVSPHGFTIGGGSCTAHVGGRPTASSSSHVYYPGSISSGGGGPTVNVGGGGSGGGCAYSAFLLPLQMFSRRRTYYKWAPPFLLDHYKQDITSAANARRRDSAGLRAFSCAASAVCAIAGGGQGLQTRYSRGVYLNTIVRTDVV